MKHDSATFQKIEPPKGYRVVGGSVTIENGHIHYLIEPIEKQLPDTPEEAFEILGCDYHRVIMVATSRKRAEALAAIADLLTLWDCWGVKQGDWIVRLNPDFYLQFKTKNIRDQFQQKFRNLINTAKNLK
jgi:hypothetical protein